MDSNIITSGRANIYRLLWIHSNVSCRRDLQYANLKSSRMRLNNERVILLLITIPFHMFYLIGIKFLLYYKVIDIQNKNFRVIRRCF